jgi:ABC-type lipoprotein release transport system permease subunit
MNWWIFLSAGIFAWLLALIAITAQSLKAANENPVESLRFE